MIAPAGFGKPRPAVVIQATDLTEVDTILVCLITTFRRDTPHFRVPVEADTVTGLLHPSQIMVEKIHALKQERCGQRIGQVDQATLIALNERLAFVLGLADA